MYGENDGGAPKTGVTRDAKDTGHHPGKRPPLCRQAPRLYCNVQYATRSDHTTTFNATAAVYPQHHRWHSVGRLRSGRSAGARYCTGRLAPLWEKDFPGADPNQKDQHRYAMGCGILRPTFDHNFTKRANRRARKYNHTHHSISQRERYSSNRAEGASLIVKSSRRTWKRDQAG